MASARKKQDEKHLKILRELVSNPQNRQCFDCHQRGPTYVNMTIGSFVCTSCSGLLRGLTPPQRVKSISMATFSPEEIELISSKGNEWEVYMCVLFLWGLLSSCYSVPGTAASVEQGQHDIRQTVNGSGGNLPRYCRRIWLGLYEPGRVADARDEQGIKDFMIAKYEKKRYYLDPSMANMNGVSVPSAPPALSIPVTSSSASTSALHTAPLPANVSLPPLRPLASLVPSLTLPAISTTAQTSSSSNQNAFTPDGASSGFLVDFGSSLNTSSANTRTDAFGMPTATNNVSNSSNFANFDNNPIFDATNETDLFGSLPLSSFGAASVQTSTFPAISFNGDTFSFSTKFDPNHWSVPPASTLTTSQSFPGVSRKMSSGGGNVYQQPPAEDRYAALKDLDCLMKSQQNEQVSSTNSSQPDWIQAQSASPPWSAFGTSPQPGGFLGQGFLPDSGSTASNPFTGTSSSPWSVSDSGSANPFRTGRPAQPDNSPGQFAWGSVGTNVGVNGNTVNGFHSTQPTFPSSQSLTFPTKSWNSEPVGNPFILGSSPASGSHSSNPFL